MPDYDSEITIGLDIGYDAVRLVAVEHAPEGPILTRLGLSAYDKPLLPVTLFQNPDQIISAARKVLSAHGGEGWPVTVGLRNRFASVIMAQIPKKKTLAQCYEGLIWEAGQFLDASLDHYIIDVSLLDHISEHAQDAIIVAARKEPINVTRASVISSGVEPVGLTVACLALVNAFSVSYQLSAWESVALAHIEPGAVDIVLIRDQQIRIMVIPIDPDIENEVDGLLAFGEQLRYILNFMPEDETPDTVYVSGVHPLIPRLCAVWGDQLNLRVTQAAPFVRMTIPESLKGAVDSVSGPSFMVAAGLALERF